MRRPRRSVLRHLRVGLIPLFGQALGLAVLVAVLAAALVSAPLMVASAEQGAWEQEQARLSPRTLGTTLNSSTLAQRQFSSDGRVSRAAELDAAVEEAATAVGLADPVAAGVFRDPLLVGPATGPVGQARILFRDGAAEHVEIAAGTADGDGVLVPVEVAEAAGVGPGGHADPVPRARDPADGAGQRHLRDCRPLPVGAYWEGLGALFLPTYSATGDLVYPPPVLIAPTDVAFATGAATFEDLFLEWFFPLDPGVEVDEARERRCPTSNGCRRTWPPRSQAVTGSSPTRPTSGPPPVRRWPRPSAASTGPSSCLEPPVRAVGIGGGLAALVLIGAWAGQRMRRREDEVRSLVARGLSAGPRVVERRPRGPAAGASPAWRPAGPPAGCSSASSALARRSRPARSARRSWSSRSARSRRWPRSPSSPPCWSRAWTRSAAGSSRTRCAGSRGCRSSPWSRSSRPRPWSSAEPDPDGGSVDVLTLMVPLLITVTAPAR